MVSVPAPREMVPALPLAFSATDPTVVLTPLRSSTPPVCRRISWLVAPNVSPDPFNFAVPDWTVSWPVKLFAASKRSMMLEFSL